MLGIAENRKYRICIVILIGLSIVGNSAHWKVLCFGADGHVEIESAFHESCEDQDHCSASDQNILSSKEGREICEHCGPCVDIPIFNELVQISKTNRKLNVIYPIESTYILIETDKNDISLSNIDPNSFADTSYYDPLRTVILLV